MKAYYFRYAGTMFLTKILAFSEDEAWDALDVLGSWCGADRTNSQLARVSTAL